MIVIEKEHAFLMIKQHDHAWVSAKMAATWAPRLFLGVDKREDVRFAIEQHDYSWHALDESPQWNREKHAPYSFMDYPMQEKVAAYIRGLATIEKTNRYAALLCSKHYLSFFNDNQGIDGQRFCDSEYERQQRLRREVSVRPAEIDFHFNLLQFCDQLSLFLCMTEVGARPGEGVSWFKGGFPQTFPLINEKIYAKWTSETEVVVAPFPFHCSFTVRLPVKVVRRTDMEIKGVEMAYKQASVDWRVVSIRPSW